MNTGQTVYEQLQEIVNKCIELGWKPRGKEMSGINYSIIRTIRLEGKKIIIGGLDRMEMHDFYSYHDLFSVESGIMEFVEWKEEKDHRGNKKEIAINPDIVGCVADVSYRQKNVEYHYMIMSHLTSEQKIQYFLENAIIPTK